MVSPDSRLGTVGIYIQYIYITKIVVLVSDPVRGRSRATELPCYLLLSGVSEKFVRMDTLVRYMEPDELKDQENTHGHDACNSNNSTNK